MIFLEGWIKLYRGLIDDEIFSNPRILKVWIWCLLRASHKTRQQIIGHKTLSIHPGQFITGQYSASEELGMPRSTTWSYLKTLESIGSISIKSGNKYSLITVLKWDVYQVPDENPGNKLVTNGHLSATNNNVKNAKNKNNTSSREYNEAIDKLFDQFWENYPRRVDKKKARNRFHSLLNKNNLSKKKREKRIENMGLHLQRYIEECKDTDMKYIKHPATWLNAIDFDTPPEEEGG